MSDLTLKANVGAGTEKVATDLVGSSHYPLTKIVIGGAASAGSLVSDSNPLPVTGSFYPVTQPVSGTVSVSGSVAVTGSFYQATQPVSVADPITVSNFPATQAISAAALPLPTGAATEATLTTLAGLVKAEDSAAVSGDAGIAILALRQSSDAVSTSADGDYANLKTDEEGRLKVSSKPASYADITGDITAIQATIGTPVAGGTVAGDVSRASNVMAFCAGTFAGVNVSFEGSLEATGDTNWFGIQAVRTNANTIETATGALSAQPVYAWEMSVNALARVRVRATARTSGTQSWRFKLGTYATEPIPAIQVSATQPVSGTVTITHPTPTASNVNSAASTNATVVKASAGTVYNVTASNVNASPRYLKLYNKATAPTVGTDVPLITIAIPATSTVAVNFGVTGHRFATGVGLAITAGAADSDTAAVGANEVKVLTAYI